MPIKNEQKDLSKKTSDNYLPQQGVNAEHAWCYAHVIICNIIFMQINFKVNEVTP